MVNYIAKAIRMKGNIYYSDGLLEIKEIYLEDVYSKICSWHKKENIHDYLINHPKTIVVKEKSGPFVVPAISSNNEKYVKSTPNGTIKDNLLSLPRR